MQDSTLRSSCKTCYYMASNTTFLPAHEKTHDGHLGRMPTSSNVWHDSSVHMQRDVVKGVTLKTLPASFHHRPYFKTPCLLAFSEAPASFSSSLGIFGPLGM